MNGKLGCIFAVVFMIFGIFQKNTGITGIGQVWGWPWYGALEFALPSMIFYGSYDIKFNS